MSDLLEILAQPRSDTGKGASRRLRRTGLVPGIVYGANAEPVMISVRHNELERQLDHEVFYSSLLDLKLGDQTTKVVLKDLQRHPAKPFLLHVDFLRVSSDEKLRLTIPIHFLNQESCPGVKLGGKVSHNVTEIEVSCLPADLPEYLAVDMAEMNQGDIVHVSELQLPPNVELTHSLDPETPVVMIYAPQAESTGEEGADDAEGGGETAAN
ncbi:MAG: 50S ribosomal protein L25/general stress protein Ctc [Chromatiaceae bacterium]|nr:50S ribosomal protein L25/general stress protein Ctc [Chromatiaceae bacterium]MCF7993754.1 50S ribosomal protein L25/general stress protein Ctc [Chromatiaceae bacterium]MCF8003908.1 50S ribosomal protein L25/general stress protein Ctc [Chromatiaceae bacterium]MCF8014441.1 50S ribosomal protein L25/general stress protein Ctc [Chromatiaceae bacterium]